MKARERDPMKVPVLSKTILNLLVAARDTYRTELTDCDWEEEEANLRAFPKLPHFDVEQFKFIAKWKVTTGTSRQLLSPRNLQPRNRLVSVTRRSFNETNPEKAIEALVNDCEGGGLFGVQFAVASAILTFHDPKNYTVLDPRALATLTALGVPDMSPDEYSGNFYAAYLSECRLLAARAGFTLREMDRALYTLGGCSWVIPAVQADT